MSLTRSLSQASVSSGSLAYPEWARLMNFGDSARAIRYVEDLKVLGVLVSEGPHDGQDVLHVDQDRLRLIEEEHAAALRMEPIRQPRHDRPQVSMVITTNGRADLLRTTLLRLAQLTPPDEIILVDDGTPDDSVHRVAKEMCRLVPLPLPIKYVYNNNPGMTNCCHARNVALKMAAYDEILTTEPECWYVTDVVAQLLDARAEHPDDILSAYRCYHAPDITATLNLDVCDTVPAWPYLNLWRKEWLLDVGGWDEQLPGPWGWDDSDLYNRLLYSEQSIAQHFVLGVTVHHQWHPSRIEPAAANEAHVRAKEFPRDLVANVGRRWGRLLT